MEGCQKHFLRIWFTVFLERLQHRQQLWLCLDSHFFRPYAYVYVTVGVSEECVLLTRAVKHLWYLALTINVQMLVLTWSWFTSSASVLCNYVFVAGMTPWDQVIPLLCEVVFLFYCRGSQSVKAAKQSLQPCCMCVTMYRHIIYIFDVSYF